MPLYRSGMHQIVVPVGLMTFCTLRAVFELRRSPQANCLRRCYLGTDRRLWPRRLFCPGVAQARQFSKRVLRTATHCLCDRTSTRCRAADAVAAMPQRSVAVAAHH